MERIRLTGKHAIEAYEYAVIDDDDLQLLSGRSWKCSPPMSGGKRYAMRNYREDGKHRTEYMHRTILSAEAGLDVDHINHDGLDNRKSNLRVVDRSTNLRNWKPVAHSGECKKCGIKFTLPEVASGGKAHIKYCGDQCRPSKVTPEELAAAKAWKESQGIG